MKIHVRLAAIVAVVLAMSACKTEMSPALKEAQGLAESIGKMKSSIDSTLTASLNLFTEKLNGVDPTDSASLMSLNGKLAAITGLKSELSAWTAPAFPSVEELAKGDLKDEDVLSAQKGAMNEILKMKERCDALLQQ